MTTLFNLFCPFVAFFSLSKSLVLLILVGFVCSVFLVLFSIYVFSAYEVVGLLSLLFPNLFFTTIVFYGVFIMLFFFNVISLVCYSYPITTTLSFNFSMSLFLWLSTIFFMLMKSMSVSSLLPVGSPWYLVSFLSVVEAVSLFVRPITLCFRLLANMSAGHIMLGLMCKLPFGFWLLGSLFGVLELMVAAVQAFVFTMLFSVYYLESLSH